MQRSLLAACALTSLAAGTTSLHAQIQGQWTPTGGLQIPRQRAAEALAGGGTVLAAGGYDATGAVLASAEIYRPLKGAWTLTGSMAAARELFPAVMLANGRVLVEGGLGTGGSILATAELFDPKTGVWTPAGSLKVARYGHTATLLPNGRVLVAGGCTAANCGTTTSASELYDPATNAWRPTGSLANARGYQTAVRLGSGAVLAIGGISTTSLTSCELYTPSTRAWTPAGSTIVARYLSAATLLPDGRVLASGGASGKYPLNSAELYDPAANAWTPSGPMTTPRYGHSATLLADGTVVLAGGYGQSYSCGKACTGFIPTPKAEIFTPATNSFAATSPLGAALAFQDSVALTSGRALVNEGVAEIYTPLSLSFSAMQVDFGTLQTGLTSPTQTVSITNVGKSATSFSAITASGDFSQTNTCPATLAQGQSCSITIAFAPTKAGARVGAVTLKDNDPGSPTQTIATSGLGEVLALALAPTSFDFGTVAVTTIKAQTATLINDGAVPVAISGITIAPANATFTQTNSCPASLGVQQSCTIQVTFAPPDVLPYKATLSVANDAGAAATMKLAGIGADAP